MTIKIPKPRKIVGYSYTKLISLPKFWVEHHQLKRRDCVKMEIDDDMRLILTPAKESETNQTT